MKAMGGPCEDGVKDQGILSVTRDFPSRERCGEASAIPCIAGTVEAGEAPLPAEMPRGVRRGARRSDSSAPPNQEIDRRVVIREDRNAEKRKPFLTDVADPLRQDRRYELDSGSSHRPGRGVRSRSVDRGITRYEIK